MPGPALRSPSARARQVAREIDRDERIVLLALGRRLAALLRAALDHREPPRDDPPEHPRDDLPEHLRDLPAVLDAMTATIARARAEARALNDARIARRAERPQSPDTVWLPPELRARVVHADETPVQMLDPGHGKTKTAYLFAYRRGEIAEPPIIVFDFAQSRSGKHARAFLADYGGALVVDDYAGYKHLFQSTPMRELGCWAHARRKFFELHEANQSPLAAEVIPRIAAIYEVEREAKDMTASERLAHRQQHARPKVEALLDWLEGLRPKINSGSATAKAVDYLLRRKAAFTAYLGDGHFPIDNNPIENAIRPVALGRKNWLFAGSLLAGQRAANIMSLIQTAKANGHDPHAYLRDVLTRLPTQLNSRIGELLPHTWRPATA